MAATFTKIATVTVGSGGASSIDFSSIPSTYTDLCLVYSARLTTTDTNWRLKINGSASSIYSEKGLLGNGSSASSFSVSNASNDNAVYINSSGYTASTFSNCSIYFPSYTSSNNKSYSGDFVTENNATGAISTLTAGLFASTSAITSLSLYYTNVSGEIAQYSTATLYGISNS